MSTIICDSFSAEMLPGGRVRLVIQEGAPLSANPNRRMGVADVAALVAKTIGKTVTSTTVYRWARMTRNRMPAHKALGKVFFIEDEVSSWLMKHTSKGGVL